MVSEDFNEIEWRTGRQVKKTLKRQDATKSLTGRSKDAKRGTVT